MRNELKDLLERVHSPGAMRDWRHDRRVEEAKVKKNPSKRYSAIAAIAEDFAEKYLASMYVPEAARKYKKAMARAIARAVSRAPEVQSVISDLENDEEWG